MANISSKFEVVTVDDTDFLAAPHVINNVKFQDGILMVIKSGDPVEYSFDGETVHGELTLSTDLSKVQFDHRRVKHIYFRLASGASADVAVHLWSNQT